MKKIVSLLLAAALMLVSLFAFSACAEEKPVIGIIQFGSHASLNNCYDGVMAGLTESGIDLEKYTIEYVNSNFDASVSQTQANTFVNKKAAEAYEGMQILDSVVSDITTIDAKTNELIERGADCFINLLDNTIVGKLETNILPITNEKKIPVFGSEIEQVKVGCAASASIDYIDVGKSAGKAAAEILGGKNADDIPVAVITEPTNYYNSKVCELLGLTIPDSVTATDVAK